MEWAILIVLSWLAIVYICHVTDEGYVRGSFWTRAYWSREWQVMRDIKWNGKYLFHD